MMREIKSAEEIQAEVTRLFRLSLEFKGSADKVNLGPVVPLSTPDHNGCNWTIEYPAGMRYHVPELGIALAHVKRRWNLAD